ncbi:MAG: cyclic nucleotide-binding domain-containing protein [Spirochaetales bacterium]|nr:cyclic nucleotide-binding domain-containing protein [Spirochaetales bacterium]
MEKVYLDFLIKQPLFNMLNEEEITEISKSLAIEDYQEGEIIIKEGDFCDKTIIIYDGEIALIKEAEPEDTIQTYLTERHSYGEIFIIDNGNASYTLQAAQETIIISLTSRGFGIIEEKSPQLANKILKNLIRYLTLNIQKMHSRVEDYMLPLG